MQVVLMSRIRYPRANAADDAAQRLMHAIISRGFRQASRLRYTTRGAFIGLAMANSLRRVTAALPRV